MQNHYYEKTILLSIFLITQPAIATDFTIVNGQTVVTQQVLNDNETGIIEAGGQLNTITFGDAAIDAVGINNTIDNIGSISTISDFSKGIISRGSNPNITNSGSISTIGASADGILVSSQGFILGATARVTNSGNISTVGRGIALSVVSLAPDFTAINSGSISTSGINAHGIWSGIATVGGAKVTISNSGSISTVGDFAHGIYSIAMSPDADLVNITNSGSISTTNLAAHGINSTGSNVTATNSGDISTSGVSAYGISSSGADARIINKGSILLNNSAVTGIDSYGTNVDISNSGSISLSSDGFGIKSSGASATINNSGSIILSNGGRGIRSDSTNATINNSGVITCVNQDCYGIESASGGTLNNSGLISVAGTQAIGIYLSGLGSIITNSGDIRTTGVGIFSFGPNAIITNNGSISTIGASAKGIILREGGATISNTGSVTVIGDNATGIESVGLTTINNSGLISAMGTDAYAILGGPGMTLNLHPGSQIIGRIDLGEPLSDLDIVNIHGGNTSANLIFENTEVINLIDGAGVVAGNNVITVDPTGESTRGVALAGLTSSIHTLVSRRMAHSAPPEPIQLASLTLSPGMLFQESKPVAWAQVFGGTSDRDSEGSALGYDHDQAGFTLGYEWDLASRRVGLMGGVAHAKTETQTMSFETETDSYFMGAYGHFNLGSVNLTAALLGGYSDYENDRSVVDNLNGIEVARSDFDSWF